MIWSTSLDVQGLNSMLPTQGVQAQSLVKDLDPTCYC